MRGVLLVLLAAGCASSGDDADWSGWDDDAEEPDTDAGWDDPADTDAYDTDAGGGGGLGVGQGGSQDFGLFKQILEAGQIPGPDTIDDVGFFNEHKILFPAPTCGEDVCVHGRFGSLGNMITGGDCTIVLLGLNTPIDASEVERPPLNLALVIDSSGSMRGDPMTKVRDGLLAMLPNLEPEDRITLVDFDAEARTLVEHVAPDDPALAQAIEDLVADGSTNLHDALVQGFAAVQRHASQDVQNRVMLLSDGVATSGVTSGATILDLATGQAEEGIVLSTVGVGDAFDVDLMRGLSEVGAGAFYFVQDAAAVEEVFVEEMSYVMVPLAESVDLSFLAGAAWRVANVYGTRLFEVDGQGVEIDIPNLQIAHRTTSQTTPGTGRRGGGGAILVELLPGQGATDGEVGSIDLAYTVPFGDLRVEQEANVTTPFASPISPEAGHFDDDQVNKAFVMLNLYVGFREAATLARDGQHGAAFALLQPLRANVLAWLEEHDDDDIEDDLRYVDLFLGNLGGAGGDTDEELPPEDEDDDWLWD